MERSKVGPVSEARLPTLRTVQRVPFSSRLQETPKIQTVPSMSPSYRFRRLAVTSITPTLPTNCDDIALA